MKTVDLKTAKLLKKLGYDGDCIDYYLNGEFNGPNEDGSYTAFDVYEDFNGMDNESLISAPWIYDVINWLDNNYKILVLAQYTPSAYLEYGWPDPFTCVIWDRKKQECFSSSPYSHLEQTLEAGVKQALKYIRENNIQRIKL